MIQQFPSNRADESFRAGIKKRAAGRDSPVFYLHLFQGFPEFSFIAGIPVGEDDLR